MHHQPKIKLSNLHPFVSSTQEGKTYELILFRLNDIKGPENLVWKLSLEYVSIMFVDFKKFHFNPQTL